ncbi:MAG: hypothetical protein IJS29_08065 [Selenomonadaceae bacterium]|nr:hypothetical protein [Selenomonadaceae bacterium]
MLDSEELIRIKRIAYKEGRARGIKYIQSKNLPGWLEEEFVESIAESYVEDITEMIKNFLSVKTPIKFILKATGWSEEQLREFAKKENIALEEK